MTAHPIIALSGYARTGKDTVGDMCSTLAAYRRVRFADVLRQTLLTLDPHIWAKDVGWITVRFAVRAFGWDGMKEHAPAVRELLQRQGDALKEQFGDDVIVRTTLAKITGPTVITDCRFPNEAEAVEAAGGEVWRIERPGVGPANGHRSETALDGYPFARRIDNDGDLDTLAHRVVAALGEYAFRRRPAVVGERPLPFVDPCAGNVKGSGRGCSCEPAF